MARFIQAFLLAALLLTAVALFACGPTELRAGESTSAYLPIVTKPLLPLTRRVSVASDGTQGNSLSAWPSISPDGRYVAFESLASNLVPGDTNELVDIFVHDWHAEEIVRVSLSSDGAQANSWSYRPPSQKAAVTWRLPPGRITWSAAIRTIQKITLFMTGRRE